MIISKLTDLRILLLLQSFCYSKNNDELKRIALHVIEKNQNASLDDIEAHKRFFQSKNAGKNPMKHSQIFSAKDLVV